MLASLNLSLNFHPSPQRARFWLAGRGTLLRRHNVGNAYQLGTQHQRVLESGILGALTFCPCLNISSIAQRDMHMHMCSWLAAGRGTLHLHLQHGNADRHQHVRESGSLCVLAPVEPFLSAHPAPHSADSRCCAQAHMLSHTHRGDATSTALALSPCGTSRLPRPSPRACA